MASENDSKLIVASERVVLDGEIVPAAIEIDPPHIVAVHRSTDFEGRGTSVCLHLKDDQKDFLSEWKVRELVRKFADYVSFPIELEVTRTREVEEEKAEGDTPQACAASFHVSCSTAATRYSSWGALTPGDFIRPSFDEDFLHDTGDFSACTLCSAA